MTSSLPWPESVVQACGDAWVALEVRVARAAAIIKTEGAVNIVPFYRRGQLVCSTTRRGI